MPDTVRKTILEYFKTQITAVTATTPVGDPYGLGFSVVEIGPLGDWDARKQFSVGIVAGKEKKDWLYPLLDCHFMVSTEFKATANRTDAASPGEMAEDVLGVLQRVIYADRTLGGLAIDTKEHGNEVDLTTYADRSICGVIHWEVHYRTSIHDPRSSSPNFG